MVFDFRDHPRLGRIADIDDAEPLVVRYVSVFAVFADAKFGGLISAVEVGVRQDREVFQLAVNQDGYPLSPDVIALPDVAYRLPASLVDELLALVGSMWSNATAPAGALPPGVPQISKREVSRAAMRIADGGQRLTLGEPALSVLSQLWLRFAGGEDGTTTFDQLRRRSRRWPAANAAFRDAVKTELDAASMTAREAALEIATTHFYLSPLALVALDQDADHVATLGIKDAAGRRLGFEQGALDLPTGDVLTLDPRRSLAAIANPDSGVYTVELEGLQDGEVELSLRPV